MEIKLKQTKHVSKCWRLIRALETELLQKGMTLEELDEISVKAGFCPQGGNTNNQETAQ